MTALVSAELLKLRTIRAPYGLLLALLAISGLAVAGAVGADALDPGNAALEVAGAAEISAILAVLLGILIVTNEYRHGTVTPTFLTTPAREWVVAAKLAAAGLVGIAVGVLVSALAFAIAIPWQAARDEPLDGGDVLAAALRLVGAFALSALLGVAIGVLVRSQIGAIVGTFAWFLVLEPVIWGLTALLTDADDQQPYLPGSALDALVSSDADLLPVHGAFPLELAYIALLVVAGTLLVVRRDAD